MQRPNQTRLKVLSSILRLETFTIADLCAHSGLTPSMVYREVGELENRDTLVLAPSRTAGEAPPRHRPPQTYRIVDGQHRLQLWNELRSFLPDAVEETAPNRLLVKAQESIAAITYELSTAALSSFNNAELEIWEQNLSKRLEDLEFDLERASWESAEDFSEAQNSDHPIVRAERVCENLLQQFHTLMRAERDRRAVEWLRKIWSDVLGDVTQNVLLFVGAGFSPGPAFAIDPSSLRTAFESALSKRRGTEAKQDEKLASFLSSLKLGLLDAQSPEDLLRNLAKQTIEYALDVDQPLAICKSISERSSDYRLTFNKANFEYMASDPRAFDSWREYLDQRVQSRGRSFTMLARVLKERWSTEAYREIVRSLTGQCYAASVSVFSQSPFDTEESYRIEPRLYNPIHDRDENQTAFIPMSEALARKQGLYVLTTQAEQLIVPGVASLILANFLVRAIPSESAWDVATNMKPGEHILKVDFLELAETPNRKEAERVLESTVGAEILA